VDISDCERLDLALYHSASWQHTVPSSSFCCSCFSFSSVLWSLPACLQMSNPALQPRHWSQVFAIVGQPYQAGQPVCVDELLRFGVLDKLEDVQAVTTTAAKEYSMLKMLEKMERVRCCCASFH
jgi:hypothetical protein